MVRIGVSFIKNLFADGFKIVGLVGPALSAIFWIAKLGFGAQVMLQDWSYAWGLLPITIWLAVAYFRRWHSFQELERESEKNRPKMVGRVEQFSEGDGAGVLACMFNITIKNQGLPSMIDGWEVALIRSTGERVQGQIQAISKINVVMDDGVAQVFTSADTIYEKAVKSPIPQGGMVRGWLAVNFPGMTRDNVPDDCFYQIYFYDIFDQKHTIIAKKGGKPNLKKFGYLPDGSGGIIAEVKVK